MSTTAVPNYCDYCGTEIGSVVTVVNGKTICPLCFNVKHPEISYTERKEYAISDMEKAFKAGLSVIDYWNCDKFKQEEWEKFKNREGIK